MNADGDTVIDLDSVHLGLHFWALFDSLGDHIGRQRLPDRLRTRDL